MKRMKSKKQDLILSKKRTLGFFLFINILLNSHWCRAYEYSVGFTFGSPGLLGLRTQHHDLKSNWIYQFDYSEQVLFHNRSNGYLKIYRFDIQRVIWNLDQLSAFYFLGLDYFKGYYNKFSPSISLVGLELGGGVHLQATQSLFYSIEMGAIVPTRSEIGFDKYGLIILFAVGLGW